MKTIAIANLKGGCGKSTSSVNLAYSLMSLGKKILLIDLDPQCNSTRFFTKVNGTGKTVQNVLANPKSINQCIYRTKYKNIDIIRGLAKENDTGEYQLKNAFENLKKEYDYCIIDTRPVFDCLTKNAIHAACKLLVEERDKKEFEFLPCFEQNISDVQAEFQLYSSNCHHEETPYEIMHKLERMQYLINNYPEEFPEIQGGRMVERLAKKYNLSRSTVGEYLTISKNLGDMAMNEFEKGEIDKSAAVTLASMSEENQIQALSRGCKTDKELKSYKAEFLNPTTNEIITAYEELGIKEIDDLDRKKICRKMIEKYGKSYTSVHSDRINIDCTPKKITINEKELTWNCFSKLLDKAISVNQIVVQDRKNKENIKGEQKHLKVSYESYLRLIAGEQKCVFIKDNRFRESEEIEIYAVNQQGYNTKAAMFTITYINEQESGIEKGYALLNLEMIKDSVKE